MQRERGFTLIELLVVIAIIGILAGMIMLSLGGAREKARDAQRKSDLKQVSDALELYYSDVQGYPVVGGTSSCPAINDSNSLIKHLTNDPIAAGTQPYLKRLPVDPQFGKRAGYPNYCYQSDGANYTMWAQLENPKDSQKYKTPGNTPSFSGGLPSGFIDPSYFVENG